MKFIAKGQEPQEFINWKAQANDSWTPTYGTLSGEPKRALKAALMEQQGFICCYCERRVNDVDSHIEHFQPQEDATVDALDFGNMLCSCNPEQGRGKPRHCGSLKDSWFDPNLLISPLDRSCETRFSYTGDGRIMPRVDPDAGAAATIDRLGLDIPKIRALRRNVIDVFLDEQLNAADFKAFVAGYLALDGQGRFGEFWTTIRDLFRISG